MKLVRQPTTTTWFIFTMFAVAPIPLLTRDVGPDATKKLAIAATSTATLFLACGFMLCCKRLSTIAIVCFVLRGAWIAIGNMLHSYVESLPFTTPKSTYDYWSTVRDYAFAYPLWPERLIIGGFPGWDRMTVVLFVWTVKCILAAAVYALVAVLLARTCRVK